MSDRAFVDTNILIYAHDTSAGAKHEVASDLVERLWEERFGVLSTQVLQELYVNVRRKVRHPLSIAEAKQLLSDYLRWEVVVNAGDAILEALELEARFKLSFWDALIVQAAQHAGAQTLYSEGFTDGQVFGALRVVNPFAAQGRSA